MKFCNNCGNQMADDAQFCNNCGSNQGAAAPAAPAQPYSAPQYTAPARPVMSGSDWDGGVLDTIANSIVASLLMVFTCFIGTPWAICYMMKFIVGHAVIDGRRLRFDGTGGSLLGNWIVWLLLTIVTCGIYSFWVTPKLYKWIVSNIHYE